MSDKPEIPVQPGDLQKKFEGRMRGQRGGGFLEITEQPLPVLPPEDKEDKFSRYFLGDKWELPTDISIIASAEKEFEKRLKDAGWIDDDINQMPMAFREALINAIVHGNLELKDLDQEELFSAAIRKQVESRTNKKIRIAIKVTTEEAEIVIVDEGKGFDWKNVPDPRKGKNRFKTVGRGTLLMYSFFDEVIYNDAGNQVTLKKKRIVR